MSEQNALNTTPRIRCTYCNRRIPASSITCPHCQHNPRAFYWKRIHVVILLLLVAALLTGGVYFTLNGSAGPLVPSFAFGATATQTLPPPTVAVVVVVTRPPATATTLPPTPTRTRTVTPMPTESPTATPTLTATARLTPNAPTPTSRPSPIPTIATVPAPQLVSPADGARIGGGNKRVDLVFQPAQPIGALEWYRAQVDFLDRAGNPVSWCGFTKESSIEFPREFYDDSSPSVRSFLWRISVVRSNQLAPETCDAPYDLTGAPADPWTFYWY